MTRDRLFLLKPGFLDPALPGKTFFCSHCALLEGVLVSFPALQERLEVERVEWARPRRSVTAVAGEANQSLPLLLLAPDAPQGLGTGEFQGRRFVAGMEKILEVLTLRHGIPEPHP